MKTELYHIQLNVSDAKTALPFYKRLFAYLEYHVLDQSEEHLGVTNGACDFWIIQTEEEHLGTPYHRKATGINHLAFKVHSREDVDTFTREFLEREKILPLYDTPKEFSEYGPGYYAVFFEGPDRIKLEIAFMPKHVHD